MAEDTKHGTGIEWTHMDGRKGQTWNPTTGCSRVSEGCDHCYAEELSLRRGWSEKPWTVENARENVILHPERLRAPYHWRSPRTIFTNSMSDLFHPLIPTEFIAQVWRAMYDNPRHVFQTLTKRPKRMRDWTRWMAAQRGCMPGDVWPGWMWIGVSVESREFAYRADLLRQTPAAVRFISAEPLLGPLVCDGTHTEFDEWGREGSPLDLTGIDWVIVGGESGLGHRRLDLQWMRDLRDVCAFEGVAYFVKQLGGARPGTALEDLPEDLRVRQFPTIRAAAAGTLF
jgi:protein gp37